MVTRVGDHCLFMVGAHVAHDCQIGDHVILANNATLGGHVVIEDYAILGGLSAVHQFVRIGRHAMIGGMSGVERDVIPYGQVMGDRARLDGPQHHRHAAPRLQPRGHPGAAQRLSVPVLGDDGTLNDRVDEVGRALWRHRPGRRHHRLHPRRFEPRDLPAAKGRMAAKRAAIAEPGPLGIIAGSGGLPRRLIESCRAAGREVFVLALEGEAEPETVESVPHAWCRIGAAATALAAARQRRRASWCSPAACAGRRSRRCGPDWRAAKFFARVGYRALGDDGLLSAVVKELEREGFRVDRRRRAARRAAWCPKGRSARLRPDAEARADIARGMRVARAIGALDIGQAVVVQQGLVLGVEAIEGTDALLRRCAALRRDGPGGVLVKVEKPGQERRADRPTIGPHTVRRRRRQRVCAGSRSRPARRLCSTATRSIRAGRCGRALRRRRAPRHERGRRRRAVHLHHRRRAFGRCARRRR